MTALNPKLENTNIIDCKPQSGLCPLNCNQCFYNRPNAFYVDPEQPHIPSIEEVGDKILRVNSGHDSNIDKDLVIAATEKFPRKFYNTAIPDFDFPGPVVFTANRKEELFPYILHNKSVPKNLMFIRLRVSPTNIEKLKAGIQYWAIEKQIPVVLTFLAYYEEVIPAEHKDKYQWQVRHINSYWCPIKSWKMEIVSSLKKIGGRLVSLCGSEDSNFCKNCHNCESYYWQTIKNMSET
jgi:hypothetical protein